MVEFTNNFEKGIAKKQQNSFNSKSPIWGRLPSTTNI